MVALGAFLGASGLVDTEIVKGVLAETFASRQKLVALNHACLRQGSRSVRRHAAPVAAR